MNSLWNETDAAQYANELDLRAYTSRLLGQNPALVLHGGGNTSVKVSQTNIFGESEAILLVKGSGWDLATIKPAGFTALRMTHLLKLAKLDRMTDVQMMTELAIAKTNPDAPAPSVEAILHGALPHTWVDHTHANAIVTLTNTPEGEARIRECFGDRLVIVPYIMPGFDLAKLTLQCYADQANANTIGIVLMNHGLFTFGNSAQESYERHIALVTEAEEYIRAKSQESRIKSQESRAKNQDKVPSSQLSTKMAALRREISQAAGFPMLMRSDKSDAVMIFLGRPDLADIAGQGPATPDHVIRTKRVPLIGRDVAAYVAAYKAYFAENAARQQEAQQIQNPKSKIQNLVMLDPAPRVVLDTELGLCCLGRSAKDVGIAEDIYHHTISILSDAAALSAWQALPAHHIFDVEYWDLEQAKLKRAGKPLPFAGQIGLVTGAASGIGKACVDALLARGAAVVAIDISPKIASVWSRPDVLAVQADITDENALRHALETAVQQVGGLDMLILNAGIFPSSKKIESLDLAEWQRTQHINLDANVSLLRLAHPLLKQAPAGGRVLIIGSKNVPAPGPGAAAYSASKAALTQLARVAALEWGSDGIRVNVIHPNAVFDTGIWTDEVLSKRAASYGLSVEQYKKNNVLQVEITSHDVAELAIEMCGPLFAKTTGAQVPIDGGNDRVI
ncbi:MAG: bifunctional aldolase/short-chain dehydrogenase [Anaerolineae bacterium]|nr:bifunctional aldolase/short-chain dehydrogenase [Anaerolineae bacterium]